MSDHLKPNTVIDLENMQRVVLSVHGHQLEVKYQQKVVEQFNQVACAQKIQTNSISDNLERSHNQLVIEKLYQLLKKNVSYSELTELCRTFLPSVLDDLPQNHSKSDMIHKIVEYSIQKGNIKQVYDKANKLVSPK